MKKRILLLTLFLLILGTAVFTTVPLLSAQEVVSNCVLTKVGDPSITPSECYFGGSGNEGLLKAAEDIYSTYMICGQPPGYTADYVTLAECMKNILLGYGYNPAAADLATQSYYGRALTDNPKTPSGLPLCSQCYGFVRSAVTLMDGLGFPFCNAKDCPAQLGSTIKIGNSTYQYVGKNLGPGDIGIAKQHGYGHILIVKEVQGNVKFIALESNWMGTCYVTNNVEHIMDTDIQGFSYEFWRRVPG